MSVLQSSPERGNVSRRLAALLGLAAVTASLVVVTDPLDIIPSVSEAGAGVRAVGNYGNLPISFKPSVTYSTYLGGSGGDVGYGIADATYVTGSTSSTNFPTQAPMQAATTAADLSLTKTDSPDPVNAGQILTYTLTVHNAGPATGTGVTITDTLPAGVTFVSASAGCTYASGTVTCIVANVAPGAVSQAEIRVTPSQAGILSNTGSVEANGADPQLADN